MAAVLAAAVIMGAVSGCGSSGTENITVTEGYGPAITVTAQESVRTVPDIARICCAVRTQQDTAQAAQEENSRTVEQLVEALKSAGLEQSQIQTSDYQLNTQYDYSGDTPEIIGYEMVTQLTLTGVPLDQAGSIAGTCVSSGANEIREITYSSSSYDQCYSEALEKAIQSAREKAQTMAKAEGCDLGPVAAMEEHQPDVSARYETASKENAAVDTATAAADMAVSPGELEIEASVTVSYEIEH